MKVPKKNMLSDAYRKGVTDGKSIGDNVTTFETPVKPIEPIVREVSNGTGLSYKVSYGVSAPYCGNEFPRTSVYLEPHFDVEPMCMCIQRGCVSSHICISPEDLIPNLKKTDVVFTLNTSNVGIHKLFTNAEFSGPINFSEITIGRTMATFIQALVDCGFFKDFAEKTGYTTKCTSDDARRVWLLPSIVSVDQLTVHLTINGDQFNRQLMDVLAMEYMRLFMATIARFKAMPDWLPYNRPPFEEYFYVTLIEDIPQLTGYLWESLELISNKD